jgi:replicative DNA helicase
MKRKLEEKFGFEFGKIPPQAIDLEEATLGSMMIESNCVNDVMSIISPESFYKPTHQIIAESILQLHRENKPTDTLTVTEKLRDQGKLDEVGGICYISLLTNRICSTANVEYHARIILQKFLQREIIRRCSELINEAYNDTTDPLELVEKFGKSYDDVSVISQSGAEMVHISVAVSESAVELKKRELFAKDGKTAGIPTPVKELNRLLGGWMKTDLIIIAARPGMGKTALMLQIAKTAAKAGFPVAIFSLEMSRVSLSNRLILAESGIDDEKFRSGYVTSPDWDKFNEASKILSTLPIYIDDRPGLSMQQIKAKSVQMKRSGKCEIVLIDYLQLSMMRSENRQYNREQEVSESSRTAKGMAKVLNTPVILLSQLSRESERRGGAKTPMLSDLRESGSIEQDADIVIFPHRPAYYGIEVDDTGNSTIGVIDLIIAKHRNGPIGTVSACHNESMTRIFDKQTDTIPENVFFETINNPF